MRYLLIIAMVLSGMTFMAPQAEAGGRHYRSYRGHGHHYGNSHHYRGSRHYYRPSRHVVYRSHYYRPSYRRSYYRPAYYSGYDYGYYPRYRAYHRPRISLSFGF